MKNNTTPLILVMAITLLSSCTPVPKTELQNLPPLVEIVLFNLPKAELKVRVSHRNRATRENNQLSCQLAIKDQSSIAFNAIPIPDLTTYAVETVEIPLNPADLSNLPNDGQDLPYVLDCFLFSESFRTEQVIKKATLFAVPGSSGEYR